MAEVVVVGSCNTDMTTFADRLPKPGETLTGTGFTVGFGGKGANIINQPYKHTDFGLLASFTCKSSGLMSCVVSKVQTKLSCLHAWASRLQW
jgi:hypothetical protein